MEQEKALISSLVVNRILYGCGDRQRFTQQTPILPEVWQRFAAEPNRPQDLLITPFESTSAVALLRDLIDSSPDEGRRGLLERARFAPLQSFLAACLSFDDVIALLLPRTVWARSAWEKFGNRVTAGFAEAAYGQVVSSASGTSTSSQPLNLAERDALPATPIQGELLDAARTLTLIATIYEAQQPEFTPIDEVSGLAPYREAIIARIEKLLDGLRAIGAASAAKPKKLKKDPALIWRIAHNRPIRLADEHSRATVKADAAFRLFDVKCETITWAVIDSGVDRDHPGFYCKPGDPKSGSRVIKTYDFSILRGLLDPAYDPEYSPDVSSPALETARERAGISKAAAQRLHRNIYRSYRTEMLDWSSIEPLIAVQKPDVPTDGHGTHVAGIIGADMRDPESPEKVVVRGMCPDIRIMDCRIISETMEDTEFAVIGALQLVRYLNSHNQYIVVHGVNLSLSIPHVVESFACGRTPVCDECERLVGAGVTVVAAAGNNGYQKFVTENGTFPGYATLSITDPGNADAVITVGATHRRDPHTYGVSYFSSRGPTGDGRMKPDLVAPGERIESTLPRGETGTLDGTSQAAPHVSAAAAMLMARYPELNRQPARIKQILCASATDLGRERAFQGHGLLDTLRALQSF